MTQTAEEIIESTATKMEREAIRRQMALAKPIPDLLLNCRVGGDRHHWISVDDPDYKPSIGEPIVKKCVNCGTVKRTVVSKRYGEMLRKWEYEHPAGYKAEKDPTTGSSRISPSAVRAEQIRRRRTAKISLPNIHEVVSLYEQDDD